MCNYSRQLESGRSGPTHLGVAEHRHARAPPLRRRDLERGRAVAVARLDRRAARHEARDDARLAVRGAGCGAGGAAASVAYQPPGRRLANSRGTHRPARVVLRGCSVLPSRDDDARMMVHGARLVELGGAVERRAHARRLLDRAERRAALVEQQLSTPPRRASAARHRFTRRGCVDSASHAHRQGCLLCRRMGKRGTAAHNERRAWTIVAWPPITARWSTARPSSPKRPASAPCCDRARETHG